MVIWTIQPPSSLFTASPLQLGLFYLPLISFFYFLFNLYFSYLPRSLTAALGATIMLTLQSLNYLNFFTFFLVLALFLLTLKFLKKPQNTYAAKIPKLSQLKKQ